MPNHRGCKIDDRGAAVVHQHDTDKHGESPVSAWTEVAQHRPLDAGNVQPEHAVGQIEEGGGNVEDAAFCSAVGDVAVGEDGGGARCKVANPAGQCAAVGDVAADERRSGRCVRGTEVRHATLRVEASCGRVGHVAALELHDDGAKNHTALRVGASCGRVGHVTVLELHDDGADGGGGVGVNHTALRVKEAAAGCGRVGQLAVLQLHDGAAGGFGAGENHTALRVVAAGCGRVGQLAVHELHDDGAAGGGVGVNHTALILIAVDQLAVDQLDVAQCEVAVGDAEHTPRALCVQHGAAAPRAHQRHAPAVHKQAVGRPAPVGEEEAVGRQREGQRRVL